MNIMSETPARKGRTKRVAAVRAIKARTLPRRESMNSLAKGLSVIRAFSRDRSALRLCDVASLTSMPPATARRCLMALEHLGYIVHHGSLFYLRPKVLELTAAYLDSMNLEGLTKKRLESTAQTTGDAAAICVLDGAETVYVAHAEVRTQVRLEVHVGSRFPAHATSAGHVLLADLNSDSLRQYLQGPRLPQLAAHIGPSETELLKALRRCQRNGYATIANELGWGIVSVAVPIIDQRGRTIAALSSWSQSGRMAASQLVKERLQLLHTVSREITKDLSATLSLSLGTPV